MIKSKLLFILIIIISELSFGQVQVDKFTGEANYGLPLITVPNFRGPSVSTSISYQSDVKVDQVASEIGLGWNINAGGAIERSVNGVPDDWKDVEVPNIKSLAFLKHLGALYLNNASANSKVLDFNYSRFKMDTLNDTLRYYYPDYDSYIVSGSGMEGKIIPENYDFATIKPVTTDSFYMENDFNYKAHFRYQYDGYAEVNARYFPWDESPLTTGKVYLPTDSINGSLITYDGAGYNDENYSVVANRNRVRSSNYIEYFTNSEIDLGSVQGFMEYDLTFDRSVEDDFPQDGIGAFRITDPNGYTYHYSLPVYTHYDLNGNEVLDKDYNLLIATSATEEISDAVKGYAITDEYSSKIKRNKKYAIRWLLTAITGSDFKDVNTNGSVDEADEGYWVKYDYGLWTNEFINTFPYYGSDYSYLSNIDDNINSRFKAENDINKSPDKALSYAEMSNQLYYLNQIQTPSHTAIFTRDLRYDEQSMPINYSATAYQEGNLDNTMDSVYIDEHYGSLRFEDADHSSGATVDFTLLLQPTGFGSSYDIIDLDFRLLNCLSGVEFTLTVYDGSTTAGTILLERENGDEEGDNPPAEGGLYSLSASSGSILIKVSIDPWYYAQKSNWWGINFDLDWDTYIDNALPNWANGRQKNKPQLKLSNIFLFDNDDLTNLPTLTAIDTLLNDKLWDYQSLNRTGFYNGDWYNDYKETIDTLAIQSVALEQDYSLAQGYVNNRYVLIDVKNKSATQVEVENNKYIDGTHTSSSGKLTLNKVIYKGLNGVQTQPSHLFDYNTSDTTDNPPYNTLLQDYWGNYKSDGQQNLLRGYITNNSQARTDAWSLRKITSPLGGTTEIIYESDEYEQVLSQKKGGQTTGPRQVFAIKNVIADQDSTGVEWIFDLENQSDIFWNLYNNLPLGVNAFASIPCVWIDKSATDSTAGYYEYHADFLTKNNIENYYGAAISYGYGNLTENTKTIEALDYYDLNGTTRRPPMSQSYYYSGDSLVYSGGGYIAFEYPLGEKIYGGGTRVKELKVSNGTDTYTVAYHYEQGTASSEAGDFSSAKIKRSCYNGSGTGTCTPYYYNWGLTSYDYNPFGLLPQVGYGKITVENKGQVTAGEGKSIYSFYVLDDNKSNFEPYLARTDTTFDETPDGCGMGDSPFIANQKRLAVEIVDDFTSIWGKIKETVLEDINGNKISRVINEYERSSKGAHVSTYNYEIEHETANVNCDRYYANLVGIYRAYPTYLSKVITYSNGQKSTSEIIARDAFTSNPITTKKTSVNGTISQTETALAYTTNSTPNYEEMGSKSVNPAYYNLLYGTYASKAYRTADGLTTADFSSYNKTFWKKTAKTRYYNEVDNKYTTRTDTVSWYNYNQYLWAGKLGKYGLFDTTGFVDVTAPPTGVSDWRLVSEITLMDQEQNIVEQKGYNNRFLASKLGYDNRFTYTTASNANYVSFTASGFETQTEVETGVDYYEGEVKAQQEIQKEVDGSVYPHTGNYMVKIALGNTNGPIYQVKHDTLTANEPYSLQLGRIYDAFVWIHKNSSLGTKLHITLDGDTSGVNYTTSDTMSIQNTSAIQIGDWIQLKVTLEVPHNFSNKNPGDGGLSVYVNKPSSGDAWIDDMQFKSRVTGSGMNVYDQKTGRVMATLNDNNFATKYVYNDAGQVIEVWKEILGDTWGKWVKVESRTTNFQRAME